MNVGAHIVVSGLVQGVGFRYFVYYKAAKLGLSGFVRNLPHGSVEINVEGERGLVEELIKDIKVGPRSAMVKDLKIDWTEPSDHFSRFEIL
jgi:acylphosphatase